MKLLICMLSISLSSASFATTVYKFTDDNGLPTLSNVPKKGAETFKVQSYRSSDNGSYKKTVHKPSSKAKVKKTTYTPTFSNKNTNAQQADVKVNLAYPSVNTPTQIKRDSTRKQILELELKNELQALSMAEKDLREATLSKLSAIQIQKITSQMQERQSNVAAIRRELGF